MDKTFYVYADQKPCGEVFYIGKGNSRRVKQVLRNRFHTFVTIKHPEWKRNIVFMGTEEACLREEEKLILVYGRRDLGTGTLVNLTAGGEGVIERVITQEERDKLSISSSGSRNPLFNHTKFNWVNLDTGEKETTTIFEMHKKYGGTRPHWTNTANGLRKSHFGWSLVETKINIRSSKGKSFIFKHDKLNYFTGTQSEFCKKTGASVANACRIAAGKIKSKEGWYV